VSITPLQWETKARQAEALEFVVQEAQVERRVVDDDFGALDVVAQFLGDLVELRLVAQELGGQAVDASAPSSDSRSGLM
jgi:hypothetical protein